MEIFLIMGCLTIAITIPFPCIGLFISGKIGHGIGALIAEVIGIIMLFFAVIPVLGWIIAFLGATMLLGNMIYAVVTVANANQGIQNIQAFGDDE